jgi:hypothetical protein
LNGKHSNPHAWNCVSMAKLLPEGRKKPRLWAGLPARIRQAILELIRPAHQRSVARIAENGFAASSGVSKSAKVALGANHATMHHDSVGPDT